jgi:hypothetical protein
MSQNASEIWSAIVKYSVSANAAALVLAIGASGRFTQIQPVAIVGKFPIWCFAIGLLFAGFYLISNFVWSMENQLFEVKEKIDDLKSKNDERRSNLLSSGLINRDDADIATKINQMSQDVDSMINLKSKKQLEQLRNIQESLLWISYLMFFVGLFIAIWKI